MAQDVQLESCTIIKVDFISYLPAEVAVKILICLSLKDVLSCMRVSQNWFERIKEFTTYWKEALISLGISQYTSDRYRNKYPIYRDLALKVHKTRQYITASQPEIKFVSPSYPGNLYFQCNYSRYGVLVGTMYEDFNPLVTSVYMVHPSSGVLKRKYQFQPHAQNPLNRIVWAHVFCDYLLSISANGLWQGHNLATNKTVLSWNGPNLFDTDLIVRCCERCYMVTVVKLVSHRQPKEMYWDVQMIRLGRGNVYPSIAHSRINCPEYIPMLQAGYGCKEIALVPKSDSIDEGGFCDIHWLLMQWAESIYVHEVLSPHNVMQKPLSILQSGIDIVDVQSLTSERTNCTSFVLSSDQRLLGYIFNSHLYVWNLDPQKLQSKYKISQKNKVQVRLLAIGHIFTIIGYESLNGHVQVLSTITGNLIFGTHGFSAIGQASHMLGTPPPYFTFLGPVDEEWLNEVDALPHPSSPVLLYWDKIRHCVSGIIFRHHENKVATVQSVRSSSTSIGLKDKLKSLFKLT